MDVVEMQKWAFVPFPPDDVTPMRQLLATYSQIPPQDVDSHLIRIRDKAWAVSRAPFIGRWKFLRLSEPNDPCYRQVLFRLTLSRSRDAFLDLGCGFGQALRQLCADGVDASRLYGVDANADLIAFGYDLFRDRHGFGARLLVGDVVDPEDPGLRELRGRVTIVHAGSFFHLFTWTEQIYIGRRIVDFLKPGTHNALVYGTCAGTPTARTATIGRSRSRFLHNADSLQRLWGEVGRLTGTEWRVEVEVEPASMDGAQLPIFPRDVQAMSFTIFQVPPRPPEASSWWW